MRVLRSVPSKLRLLAAAAVLAAPAATLAAPAPAPRLDYIATLDGSCNKLAMEQHDLTRGCMAHLTNEVYRNGRVSFVFAIRTGGTIRFSGIAHQTMPDPDTAVQPVDQVVGKLASDFPAHLSKAKGECRYTNPTKGPSKVTCTATAPEGHYIAEFVSDGSEPTVRNFPR